MRVIRFENFIPGGTWENRKAKWLVMLAIEGEPQRLQIGMLKWCGHREDYAYFPRGDVWAKLAGGLTASELGLIQAKLYVLEVKG